jgi:hypothetical protein
MLAMMGCSTNTPRLTEPNAAYVQALERTDPAKHPGPEPGSKAEQEAIDRVIKLFEIFSEENIRSRIRGVYAEDVYFRDGFKEFSNLEDIERYMIHSTKPVRDCTFDFPQVVSDRGEHYLRWIMNVNLNRDPEDRYDRVIGMSHIRFNEEGKVIFQQDYWDPTDLLYRRIPIANGLIQKVRSRL